MPRYSLLLLLWIAAPPAAFAQSNPPAQFEPFYLAGPDGSRIPLANGTARLVSNPKLFYLGGSSGGWAINGQKSPVRLRENDSQVFLTSPQGMQLVKLDVIHDKREWIMFDFTQALFYGSGNSGYPTIPLRFVKDAGELRVEPLSPLAPGEYAFLAFEQQRGPKAIAAYSFGVNTPPLSTAAVAKGTSPSQAAKYSYHCILFFCSHN